MEDDSEIITTFLPLEFVFNGSDRMGCKRPQEESPPHMISNHVIIQLLINHCQEDKACYYFLPSISALCYDLQLSFMLGRSGLARCPAFLLVSLSDLDVVSRGAPHEVMPMR